ncbi:hypothetical protein [Flexivirga oryzae]|uniref:Uncharacterized protein n=1 Tax=Flexivirga oryzae TaxID=1794944 RepID=A0A839N924_9MICO|nr:hypothetical protein [Flexivirga oryzae]MBB2892146.1 hypothetical protein [Flexivirga oryzae]
MSVADCLGLTPNSELLAQADQEWPTWCEQHPKLSVATDATTMRSWLRQHATEEGDQLLLCLAQLAATDGGNDLAAAAALAWALMPGVCSLANRLGTLAREIDQVVAGQLWLEVRTFPWRRLTKVSANILLNTRAGVLRECGAHSQLERTDPTWSRTSPVDPSRWFWMEGPSDPNEAAAEELLQLLEWACDHDVITPDDRSLLLCLVEAADRTAINRTGRSGAGLMANGLNQEVATQLGISVRTLRRRTRRSIDALTDACGHGKAMA